MSYATGMWKCFQPVRSASHDEDDKEDENQNIGLHSCQHNALVPTDNNTGSAISLKSDVVYQMITYLKLLSQFIAVMWMVT